MRAVAYLALANPSTKHNLGTLIRCAAAFAVEEVVVVGASAWSTHGAHGSDKHVRCRWFDDWKSAADFLRKEKGCDLCGVVFQSQSSSADMTRPPSSALAASGKEASAGSDPTPATPDLNGSANLGNIEEDMGSGASGSAVFDRETLKSAAADDCSVGAVSDGPENTQPPSLHPRERVLREDEERPKGGNSKCRTVSSTAVRHRPFRRSTAFLVGFRNRLEDEAMDLCDFLVHVENVTDFSMELGAPVTTSIALHHFTAWANYEEREFTGEKFNVNKQATRCRPPEEQKRQLAEQRIRKREELRAADPLDNVGDGGDDRRGGSALSWLEGEANSGGEGQGDY